MSTSIDPVPVEDDFAEQLRGDSEEEDDMNVRHVTGIGYVVVALFVGLVPPIVARWVDHVDQTPTQVSLAKLEVQVSELSDQVKTLTGQPYVRRDEFEGRLSGLDQRITIIERTPKLTR